MKTAQHDSIWIDQSGLQNYLNHNLHNQIKITRYTIEWEGFDKPMRINMGQQRTVTVWLEGGGARMKNWLTLNSANSGKKRRGNKKFLNTTKSDIKEIKSYFSLCSMYFVRVIYAQLVLYKTVLTMIWVYLNNLIVKNIKKKWKLNFQEVVLKKKLNVSIF